VGLFDPDKPPNCGREIMTYRESVANAKPYVTGLIIGLIAAPIVGFSAGWVTTSGASADAVENARIETLAGVCADAVQKSFASQSMDLATLKGWDNRAARDDVVAKTMATIEVPDLLAANIRAGCGKTLA
jgi:hypothetical protein